MPEKKKISPPDKGPPLVDYKATCEVLQGKIEELQKENSDLSKDVLAKAAEVDNIKKDIARSQKTAAKKTLWNPWELVHRSKDNKDRTEVLNCGSRGVVIYRMLNGVATCVFVERVKHRCNMNSDGSYVNKFD